MGQSNQAPRPTSDAILELLRREPRREYHAAEVVQQLYPHEQEQTTMLLNSLMVLQTVDRLAQQGLVARRTIDGEVYYAVE